VGDSNARDSLNMGLQFFKNGQEVTDLTKLFNDYDITYGALSGVRKDNNCGPYPQWFIDLGEPKPVSMYNVPRECEKEWNVH
jgi:hypothetical protein